jgi:hypothetical protein
MQAVRETTDCPDGRLVIPTSLNPKGPFRGARHSPGFLIDPGKERIEAGGYRPPGRCQGGGTPRVAVGAVLKEFPWITVPVVVEVLSEEMPPCCPGLPMPHGRGRI